VSAGGPRVLFVPVSGPTGTGELVRCLVIARTLRAARPDAHVRFVVSRAAPAAIEVPFETIRVDGSPTHDTPAVDAAVREFRPHVVVFDNAGRAAQVRCARAVGARIVYVSRRPGKRLTVLRPGWIGRIDQHWLAFPPEIEGGMTFPERAVARMLGRPETVVLGAVFEESDAARRRARLRGLGIGERPYVLLVPGGGGRQVGMGAPSETFLDAATRIRSACDVDVIALGGPQSGDRDGARDGIVVLRSVAHRDLIDLIHDARVVVTNGGTTLTQALAHARVTVAVPLAPDQPDRIRRCAQRGAVVAAVADAGAIADAVRDLLGDPETFRARRRAAAALGVTNGGSRAVAALERLLPPAPVAPRVVARAVPEPTASAGTAISPGVAASEIVERLGRAVRDALDPWIPRGAACALLDFPDHGNAGDHLIWLGETAYLAERGVRVVHACTAHGYSAARIRRRLPPDGIVLLHGGGNFGDLYPVHQRLRERVVDDFPDRRIVQFPQSVRFGSRAAAARSEAAFRNRPGLTVFARDRGSLARLRDDVGIDARLCPDMAFVLGTLQRTSPPSVDVVCLARRDAESARPSFEPTAGVEIVDWADLPRSALVRVSRRLRRIAGRGGALADAVQRLEQATFAPRSRGRAAVARALVSRGRALVTDRLHGHVLALLMGVPHVVLDTREGKVRAFRETWTAEVDGVHAASDPSEAIALARALGRSR